ncbi:MAG: hypothetical protein ACLUD2_16875 [Clostridium sp.]
MAMGGKLETFAGLTGIGEPDRETRRAGMHSRKPPVLGIPDRKRLFHEGGYGRGADGGREGVYSAKAGLALAKKYQVSMPIIEAVNEVLFDGKSAKESSCRSDAARQESRKRKSSCGRNFQRLKIPYDKTEVVDFATSECESIGKIVFAVAKKQQRKSANLPW